MKHNIYTMANTLVTNDNYSEQMRKKQINPTFIFWNLRIISGTNCPFCKTTFNQIFTLETNQRDKIAKKPVKVSDTDNPTEEDK